MLRDHLRALYGVGLISKRQLGAGVTEIKRLLATPAINVQQYKRTLDYLALVPNWGTQNLRRFFGAAMDLLYRIEPKAALYIQDHLRGSPTFSYATLIDRLVRDANDQAGVRNALFGTNVGAGPRSLNPDLARGNLRLAISENIADLDIDGIYLLPETVSELPPVAGILTAGEGNPLSHVQLLARNLGIPNVGIDHRQIAKLEKHEGPRVMLTVSPSGSVRLNLDDGSTADSFNIDEADDEEPKLIQVDLVKLNLAERQFYTLSELRAADSGRIVGPKAAKLGELTRHYPQAVAEGLAIPFGIFKDILDQSFEGGTSSIFLWMQAQYERIAALPDGSVERRQETATFRAKLQTTIREADPGNEFRQRLRTKLTQTFGPDNTFGVFVRSDTNVEDLPGFTGVYRSRPKPYCRQRRRNRQHSGGDFASLGVAF
jgi:hypothetical protein